jgi:hypothetical protein
MHSVASSSGTKAQAFQSGGQINGQIVFLRLIIPREDIIYVFRNEIKRNQMLLIARCPPRKEAVSPNALRKVVKE